MSYTSEQRIAAFRKVWASTHPDFRGTRPNGDLSLLQWAKYGHGLITAATICDAELSDRLAHL